MKTLLKKIDYFNYDKKTLISNDERINTKFGPIFTFILMFYFGFFSYINNGGKL